MSDKRVLIVRGGLWTVFSYGASICIRLLSNVILTRLLAPEIFGIMVILHTIRLGIELLTDVGIEQNIVRHPSALSDKFFNTAWTMQIVRGAIISIVFLILSIPLSAIYRIDVQVFAAMSVVPFVNSLASTSIFVLVKNLEIGRRNIFEVGCELFGVLITVGIAMVLPTVWAMVFGTILSVGVRSAFSYLLPHPRHRLLIDPSSLIEIVTFGKWVFAASLIVYVASSLDRIYLGRMIDLSTLGIYGLARTIADLPGILAGRLSHQLIFPLLASGRDFNDVMVRSLRIRFLLVAAIVLGTICGWSDLAVSLLYDARYEQAGWMLFVLLMGSWFSLLANLNEAVLLGNSLPAHISYANAMRLLVVAVGIPLGYEHIGLAGAIAAVSFSELVRLISLSGGLWQVRSMTFAQDAGATAVFALCIVFWVLVRQAGNWGASWHSVAAILSRASQ